MPQIRLDSVDVEFASRQRGGREPFRAISDLSLEVRDQEFVCLVGPSGCGKSTALGGVAGFVRPTRGDITVDGVPVGRPGPDRGVAFQDANVFPWLTVRKNVAFGPTVQHRWKGAELRKRVQENLERVGLWEFRDSLPIDLSGGMRQRLALARLLIIDPPVLLMDEPFGALDAQSRIIMQELLLKLWEQDRKTVLFVTHDIDEALLLADRIYVMSAHPGRIQDVVDVPLSRPRGYSDTTSERFIAMRRHLFDSLHDEAVRAQFATTST